MHVLGANYLPKAIGCQSRLSSESLSIWCMWRVGQTTQVI